VAISPANELFEVAVCTHPGAVREVNEDHVGTHIDGECACLVVADGVSSFEGGETASKLAVQVTLEAFQGESRTLQPAKRLYRAVQQANIAIYDLASTVPELRNMATTLTAVALIRDELFAVHIGDCRLYLFRAGRLTQLSKDHTVSGERVRLGLLSERRARSHPGRSTLTRSLGRELIARADQFSRRIAEHDQLLLCSDGIHGLLDDDELAQFFPSTSAELCSALVAAANERGAPDNVTAAAARVTATPPSRSGRLRGLLRGIAAR